MFDIAIVGAGLAGAATAVLLAKRDPNLRIALLEKRSEEDIVNEKSGRAINLLLSPRGVKTLERCGLSKAELTQYFNRIDGRIVHVNNQPPMSVPYGPDRFNLSIGRGQLVSRLLSIARGLGIEIMLGQELVGLEAASNNTNTTRLTLVNQTDASIKSLDCSLVIASDGIHSMARGFVPITSKKKFTSYGYKELTIMPSDGEYAMDPRGIHIFPRGKFFMVALPNTDKTFRCTMILPLEGETSFASLNNEQKVKEFFQIHFSEIIPHMPNVTKEFTNNPTSTLGMIKCNSFHYKDRFVLIGDAAHAILPFLGQGMNLGLEDALIIDDIYARTMSLQSIGPEFTRLQKKNADAIQDMSEQNFIELSANLGSNRFLVQKKVENVLASYFPSLFMPPPFISVNFLDLTYDQVRQGLERNKAIASGVTKAAVLTSILGVALKAKL